MADPSGTTSYTYDTRNRLTQKQTPEGTLNYSYDAAGNLLTLASANANGASDTYTYDALNRLSTVADASGTTTYTYDNVGNLQSFAYPNGVTTSYAYDTLNRLNQVVAAVQGAPVASYAYTLGAAGNRTSVAELSGRSVGYGYDALYRLTQESVSADPNGKNGTVSYAYDNVGNRQQMNSTLGAVPAGVFFYNNNDQLTTDTYDANGNTTALAGITSTYDFENHMVSKGAVTIVYDGDGNRVAETVGGVTTKYLVDTQNPTGYAQVVDELQNGAVVKSYSYGLERISQRPTTNGQGPSFYGYDGHGSVRFLTNSAGTITDTYDYDAFGNLTNSTGSTPNNYLFAGEQFDPALNLYYNRARYLNTSTGRFWTMDTADPNVSDPTTLHRYLYVADDASDDLDPTGLYSSAYGREIERIVQNSYRNDFGASPLVSFGGWARVGPPSRSAPYALKPDILDSRPNRGDGIGMVWMDVKPLSLFGIGSALASWGTYTIELGPFGYSPDAKWLSGGRIFPSSQGSVLVFNAAGILFYTTNQQDYNHFQEVLEAAFGFSTSVAIGAGAGQLVNALSRSLPQVPASPSAGSEIIDIGVKVRQAIQGSGVEIETEEAADVLEGVA